ncbi:DUF6186 family protein [Blastococcus montanus]|uniref:DUF6186 family protein n=1 Tax=Blastococcus montanus TaxID=3144973 RepID=UPI0032095E0C
MSGGAVSLLGFTALVVWGAALELSAHRGDGRATLAEALAAAMRTTPGRAAVLVGWIWLGVHFLAR